MDKIRQLIVIVFCWTVLATLGFLNTYSTFADNWTAEAPNIPYPFTPNLLANILFGALGGLIAGSILVFRMADTYRRKSFAFGIFNSAILFLILYNTLGIGAIYLIGLVFFQSIEQAWSHTVSNLAPLSYLVGMVISGLMFVGTQFMLQVNDKFGPGVLWKFIKGKYSKPREENRIFMFLDLKSSTSIVEKLGHTKFFDFLNDFFKDIADPIILCSGEIYQYVGDEVVVTWTAQDGLKGNNCLSCFFGIRDTITARKDYYMNKYGMMLRFKAGLHVGNSTVGAIKKDIVYSGDVLNTTARIQGECNPNQVDLLVSTQLLEDLELGVTYQRTSLGEIQLRGKEERIELNVVSLADTTTDTIR